MPLNHLAAESVAAGHPDKLCDQISDALLDAYLEQDPQARVAVDCMVTNQRLLIAGEVTAQAEVDVEAVARQVIKEIGYDDPAYSFFADNIRIDTDLHHQSGEIARGVDTGGAGDQGMVYGYACRETVNLMPLPSELAHRLVRELDVQRQSGQLDWLRPDAKSEVILTYETDQKPRLHHLVLAASHTEDITLHEVQTLLKARIIQPLLTEYKLDIDEQRITVNGAGAWRVYGPVADSGMTGRKTAVDSYGGLARHGGGAFSGKDATKVDRSGAYLARRLAKWTVAQGLADRCEVMLSYAIGAPAPIAISVDTFGTAQSRDDLSEAYRDNFDLSVFGAIEQLGLHRPVYRQTATYGHFGRPEFSWEQLG